jgi:SAM-dependent methyltransferase
MLLKAARAVFHQMRNHAVADYEQSILAYLESSEDPISLLDCGCDDGTWTVKLGERVGNASLSGIEIVEQRRLRAKERGIDARPGDLNDKFPFPDEAFDIVHANQVIEHLADTDNFIRETYRVLKPGGYTVICTENLASWHNIFALLLGWQPFSLSNVSERVFQIGNPLAIHSGEPGVNPKSWQHVRVFAYQGLLDIFAAHGFSVESCRGSGYYLLPSRCGRVDPRHAAFLTMRVRKPL